MNRRIRPNVSRNDSSLAAADRVMRVRRGGRCLACGWVLESGGGCGIAKRVGCPNNQRRTVVRRHYNLVLFRP